MMITFHWTGISRNVYIFVSKDKVEVSSNPLINESSLLIYNIPSYYKGKTIISLDNNSK